MTTATQKVLDLQQSRRDLRAALEKIEGGHFPDASGIALAGDWFAAFEALQLIAREAIATERLADDMDATTQDGDAA